MVVSPTLQMPYGPGQPYLLQLILDELSAAPSRGGAAELYLERPGGSDETRQPWNFNGISMETMWIPKMI